MTGKPRFALVLAAAFVAAGTAFAQTGTPLSFDDAVKLALSRSDALAGAKAGVESQSHRATSLDYLDYPRVEFDAKALDSEKTVKLNLSGAKSNAETALTPYLGENAAALIGDIPSNPVLGVHNSGVQSTVTATLPLYTGGRIDASQKAAAAAVHQAGADLTLTEQGVRTRVAQVYFLCQLLTRVRDVRIEVRDGLSLHLGNAKKAEKAGTIAHAQTLQAQVAYDEAVRGLVKAEADLTSAKVALTNLLRLDRTPTPTTPLFVSSAALPSLASFVDTAMAKHGALKKLDALDAEAGEGVRIEHSARMPQVYLFGEYNLAGRNWDMTVPDWAFGLGVKYQLFSGIDRSEAEKSAAERQMQVQASRREVKNDLETAVTRAYNDVSSARDRFLLLASNIASARENVRTQDASFRAGVATSVDVVDARLALSRAEIDRAEAAYQYDEALSRLLFASGEAEAYSGYIAKADRVIAK